MSEDEARAPLAPRSGQAIVSESRVKFAAAQASGAKSLSGSYFHPNNSSFSVFSSSSKMPSHIIAEELIMRGAKRKPTLGQTIHQFYQSITHLHFGNLGIVGDVEPLRLCTNLRVLYVYENKLTSLKGLGSLHRLTHLYAQENRIESLSDFEAPPALMQLHLGSNRLSLISGLEGCTALAELYLENQTPVMAATPPPELPAGIAEATEAEGVGDEDGGEELFSAESARDGDETDDACGEPQPPPESLPPPPPPPPPSLTIEHASLMAISRSLQKLGMSSCAVDDDTLEPLIVLQNLRTLDIRGNDLESIARLQQFVVRLPELRSLRIQDNPVASDSKFRERIIVASHVLDELNGKPIKPTERTFLLSLAQRQASSAGAARRSTASKPYRAADGPTGPRASAQGPQQLGVSIPSAQSYNLGRGHGLVGAVPAGYFENGRGPSASLPSGTRRPWARAPQLA